MDIILLTSVIATLFVVFFVAIYRELRGIDENSYKHEKEGGPRVALFNLMARLFEDQKIPVKDKKTIYKAMHRTISDMESDGMYFSDEMKEELKKHRDELHCEYSGLPSVMSYGEKKADKDELFIGHS